MIETAQLYLKVQGGISGPFGPADLREMVQSGMVANDTAVSPDGIKWLLASNIRGLFSAPPVTTQPPTALRVADTADQLRYALERVERSLPWLQHGFRPAVAVGVCVTLFAVYFGLSQLVLFCLPSASLLLTFALCYVPSALLAAGAGHATGNLYLRLVTQLSASERRFVALRLPLSRSPERWGVFLRHWLYGGDWLVSPFTEDRKVYVRAFVTGAPPSRIAEEQRLWEHLTGAVYGLSSRSLEVGRSVMEMAFIKELPEWSRQVPSRTSLRDLQHRLGSVGHQWVLNLLRRARLRMPALAGINLGGDLHDVMLELYHCPLPDGREGLMVIIQPRETVESVTLDTGHRTAA